MAKKTNKIHVMQNSAKANPEFERGDSNTSVLLQPQGFTLRLQNNV